MHNLKEASNIHNATYLAALGLSKDPFSAQPDPKFYHDFDSFEQRLEVLKNLIRGTDLLVLIMGEPGSGKTTLLNRYLATSEADWKPLRIQTDPQKIAAQSQQQRGRSGHPAYIMHNSANPVVILDDAHLLPQRELAFLLREALIPGSTKKIKRLVLLGESELYNAVTWLTEKFSTLSAVNKIYLTGLSEEQTAAYLQHRLIICGYSDKNLFKFSTIKKIHQASGGYPGVINKIARQWLNDKYAKKKEGQIMLKILSASTGRAVAWVAAVGVIILMGALWFFSDRIPWQPRSVDQQNTKIVFRKKIPPGSQIANNVIRKKIAAVKTPSISPTETKTKKPQEINAPVTALAEAEIEKSAANRAAVNPPTETKTKRSENMIASVQTPANTLTTPPQEIDAAVKTSAEIKAKHSEEINLSTKASTTVKTKQPLEDKTVAPAPTDAAPTAKKPRQTTKLMPSVALTQQSKPPATRENLDQRVVQRESWILNQNSRFYTIQVIGVHNEQSLSDFVQKYRLLEKNDIAYYKSTFNGKAWYQLLYGVYPTKKDAEVAAGKLPEKIVQAGPWIRKIAKVQKVIRRNTGP